jgi:hypothetical protein
LALIFSSSSVPIGPSITLRMCASSRKMNGMLKTFSSSTTGPSAPTEMRAICSAPTCACSIISFSPPSCIEGYIWMLMRPFVAASELLAHAHDSLPRWDSRSG